jgi:hypothetical protein
MMKRLVIHCSLLLALLLPTQGWAAIAEVGAGSQRAAGGGEGADSLNVAFPGNVTSGSCVTVSGSAYNTDSGGVTVAISDTLTTTYSQTTLVPSWSTNGDQAVAFIARGQVNSSAANTVTVNPSGATADLSYEIDEWSGVDCSTISVNGAGAEGTSTNPTKDIITLTSGELIIAVSRWGSPDTTVAAGTGQTLIGSYTNTVGMATASDFRLATTATTYTGNFTLGASRVWEMMLVSFKEPAAPGAGPPVGTLNLLGVGR